MTISTGEFIRRFMLHVLPKGFHRIRHYGLLASAGRRANVARARALLAVPPVVEPAEPVELTEPQPPCPCTRPVTCTRRQSRRSHTSSPTLPNRGVGPVP